jgi:hypothetical protein
MDIQFNSTLIVLTTALGAMFAAGTALLILLRLKR